MTSVDCGGMTISVAMTLTLTTISIVVTVGARVAIERRLLLVVERL